MITSLKDTSRQLFNQLQYFTNWIEKSFSFISISKYFRLNVWNRNGDRWFSDPVGEVLNWHLKSTSKLIKRFGEKLGEKLGEKFEYRIYEALAAWVQRKVGWKVGWKVWWKVGWKVGWKVWRKLWWKLWGNSFQDGHSALQF